MPLGLKSVDVTLVQRGLGSRSLSLVMTQAEHRDRLSLEPTSEACSIVIASRISSGLEVHSFQVRPLA